MLQLGVIVASTRPGRAGLPIASWFVEAARGHGKFEVSLLDLKEIALPMFDEPKHPRLGQYEHAHTKAWSALVKPKDAFVIVTPEYNFGTPPALVNALDYLHAEWQYKAAGFVSYGGVSGGTRSVAMTKQLLTTLKVMPMFEAVAIPFFANHLKDGRFEATAAMDQAATTMLDEVHRWAGALAPLRA